MNRVEIRSRIPVVIAERHFARDVIAERPQRVEESFGPRDAGKREDSFWRVRRRRIRTDPPYRAKSTITRHDPECRLMSERTGHVRDIFFRPCHEQRIRKPRKMIVTAQTLRHVRHLLSLPVPA